jgi:hypothetical protein
MVFVFLIALLPPSQVSEDPVFFELFMVVGTIAVCAVPLLIYLLRRPEWTPRNEPSLTGPGIPDTAPDTDPEAEPVLTGSPS